MTSVDDLYVMPIHLCIAVSVNLCTALIVNVRMQVNIQRVLGVLFAHGTADLLRGHAALVKPFREEAVLSMEANSIPRCMMIRFKAGLLMSHGLARSAEMTQLPWHGLKAAVVSIASIACLVVSSCLC